VRTVQEIGGLDAHLFVYDEDADWCLRAKRTGLKTLVVTAAHAYHDVPRGKFQPRHVYYLTRNRLVIAKRHEYLSHIFDGAVMKWVAVRAWTIMWANHDLAFSCSFAFWAAVFDFLRNRMGECPASFNRPPHEFMEAQIRRRLRVTWLWQSARRAKTALVRIFS
jgi:GT2 family glycosyltransferase